jgi:hypothetical protein
MNRVPEIVLSQILFCKLLVVIFSEIALFESIDSFPWLLVHFLLMETVGAAEVQRILEGWTQVLEKATALLSADTNVMLFETVNLQAQVFLPLLKALKGPAPLISGICMERMAEGNNHMQ